MLQLALLSAERVQVADQVAASKRASGKPVEDAAREAEQLQKFAALAGERRLAQDRLVAFFRAQIEASKLVQYQLLLQDSRATSDAAPALEALRARLDRINEQMLDRFPAAVAELDSPDCNARLRTAITDVSRERHLDRLHRIALVRSLGDLCREH